MRFYAKLLLLIAVFVCLSNGRVREMTSELAYEARVKYVLAFGSPSDYERLVDHTERMLAARSGRLDVYLAGKHYRQLLADRKADVARRNIRLSEEELLRLESACAREAFAPLLDQRRGLGRFGRADLPDAHELIDGAIDEAAGRGREE